MFAVQGLCRNAPKIANTMANQSRKISGTIGSKPRNRVPFAEKIAHGLVFTTVPLMIPLWVLVHLKEYRGEAES